MTKFQTLKMPSFRPFRHPKTPANPQYHKISSRHSSAKPRLKQGINRIQALSFSLLVLISSTILPASSVLALPDSYQDLFVNNSIIFYDPEGINSTDYCITGSVNCGMNGNTKEERLWSGLRHVGFTPEQTAAIMGNIAHEAGSPTTQENAYNIARNAGCTTLEGNPYTIWTFNNEHHSACMARIYSPYSAGKEVAGIGLGIVQWTAKNRREGYLGVMRDLGLLKYFEGDAYKLYGSLSDEQLLEKIQTATGSDSDYWALWCAAIQFIKTEMDSDTYNNFYSQSGVEAIAGWVSAKYEICNGCQAGQASYVKRVQSAREIYDRYLAGEFDNLENASPSTSDSEDGSNITIIGDSITEGAKSAILQLLPNADIHAQVSKSFSRSTSSNPSGMSIAQSLKTSNSLRPQVIFALGTNDPGGIGTDNINKLVNDIIGPNYNIFFVSNYDSVNSAKYATNNAQLTAAAASYDNVHLIDWQNIVENAERDNPGTEYIYDETSSAGYAVHPTTAGAELFAQAIYEGVTGVTSDPYNCNVEEVTTADQALIYLQQFIIDTNTLYNKNYKVPQSAEIGKNTGTPGGHSIGSINQTVLQDWASRGLLQTTDRLGGCWGAADCGQCTALSGWFTTMLTDYEYNGGNGGVVVSNLLIKNPELTSSQTPTPFSVFSEDGSSHYGHTGVVLGELGDGSYLTIENNLYNGNVGIRRRDNFAAKHAVFVDLSDKLKLEHLGTSYD